MVRSTYLASVWLIGGLLAAQPPYVKQGSIGKVKEATKEAPTRQQTANGWPLFPTLPMSQWVGQRVIFKPYDGPEDGRHFGYQHFHREGSPIYPNASFDELSGKMGRIVAVSPATYPYPPNATVELDGSGARYVGNVVNGHLVGLAFLDEIDQARKELIGKTAWVLSPRVKALRTYSEESHEFGSVPVRRFSTATILDVVVGTEGVYVSAVRLILRSEGGEEGFLPVYLSGTNAPPNIWQNLSFSSLLSPSDPKKEHTWPKAIWDAIQDGKAAIGMSTEQVKMALGEPASRTQEQTATGVAEDWTFENGTFVHFARGVVTKITEGQSRPSAVSGASAGDEITRILQSGRYQTLPPLQQTPSASSGGAPRLTVHNQTTYFLRIVLSSPFGTKTLSLPPGGSQSIDLSAGTYKALASVSAPNVLPAVGDYSFSDGSEYSITYTTTIR